jgi:hypothetical protein
MTNKVALAIAGNADKKAADRVKAIESTEAITYETADLDVLAAVVVDTAAAASVRRAALDQLLVAQFANPTFPKWRKKFITALVKLMDEPSSEFAEAALGQLVKLKVPAAQTKLLNILRSPAEAPISAAKALQLLRYDVHTDAYPIARELAVDATTDDHTRQAALRLLAADPEAAGLFEKLLKSKEEAPEVRRVCAAALNNLKPKAYQKFAQESVLDDDEHNAVRAQSLTALATLGDSESLSGNDRLTEKVKELRSGAPPAVKKAARQYLEKISDE